MSGRIKRKNRKLNHNKSKDAKTPYIHINKKPKYEKNILTTSNL